MVLVLLTAIPAVAPGVLSFGLAQIADRLGFDEYETNGVIDLGLLVLAWIAVTLLITTSLLQIVAVTRSMVGTLVTRDVTDAASGWVLGVMLVFVAFVGRSTTGVYRGGDRTGRPQGLLARHLLAC